MTAGPQLASPRRRDMLVQMAQQEFDILIIGGGITGAGTLLDAVSRGFTVAMVEKGDFAGGTSSRSTKLIHGGLRYLKQGDIKLVREVGRERAILHKNAPHIVIPEKMLLPIVDNGTYGRFATSAGLWLYDALAGVKREERRKMLSAPQTLLAEPLLRNDIVKGGGLYVEYRTDDARLTIEVVKTAVQLGAFACNHARAEALLYEHTAGGRVVVGAAVVDEISGERYNLRAKKVVNAAGPWVDQLRDMDGSKQGKRLHLTKGVHIVVPHRRLPISQSIYFDTEDGRMVFAIPRDGVTYIGTTDTNYADDIDHPTSSGQDAQYLLDAVNYMFPTVGVDQSDIASSWAGLRPLIHEDGKSPSELSRKDEIFVSPTGLISIAGGKLTGYRKMAERLVDLVNVQLHREEGRPMTECLTDRIALSGSGDPKPCDALLATAVGDNAEQLAYARQLLHKYGDSGMKIVERFRAGAPAGDDWRLRWVLAELDYAVEEEMAVTLSDFLVRRTARLYFARPEVADLYPAVHAHLCERLGFRTDIVNAQLSEFERLYRESVDFSGVR